MLAFRPDPPARAGLAVRSPSASFLIGGESPLSSAPSAFRPSKRAGGKRSQIIVRHAGGQKGFTLIEALVALVALGLVVGGALTLIAQNARFIAAAEDRLAARILADNLMVEALAASAPLEREEASGETRFAGRDLRWRRVVVETGADGVVRIDIDVRRSESGQTLAAATSLKRERS
ncbi:MAG: hypothetical protein Kow00133_20000 [Amphiplicatus sp.]